MDRAALIDRLNSLLAAERAGMLSYLPHSTAFTSWGTAYQEQELRRMVRENDEHIAWLIETITTLHGGVGPSARSPRCAELNYQDLRFVLPRVLDDEKKLVATYEAALPMLASEPKAVATASRILQRHREHVAQMSRFLAQIERTASAGA